MSTLFDPGMEVGDAVRGDAVSFYIVVDLRGGVFKACVPDRPDLAPLEGEVRDYEWMHSPVGHWRLALSW